MQRPLLVKGDQVVIGRPKERATALFETVDATPSSASDRPRTVKTGGRGGPGRASTTSGR